MELVEAQTMPQGQAIVHCKYCGNTGKVHQPTHVGILDIGSHAAPCPVCHGTGYQRI